ncbi:conserved hypothetical protein [Planktothrix rubescens CCAP 1459/22]|uniref:Uncharacterized protein n=1 Tax=Planktothrix rubescens CCAP 1459/22 TaxID=329571 RepID=A0A6J7ZQJ9_PLARU|nr:conserved hypothetical protein [Planktothrix rubescens NIVA-CYA 18]
MADVDKPIRDYLTQNWLRDAKGDLREVSSEWVSAFEGLMRPPQPPRAVSFSPKNLCDLTPQPSSLLGKGE